MIELERHIEILLLKNDCVIVPCLGGFIASHIPAKYDERDNLFLPPLRTLGFNPKLNINDSLLVQSYAEAYDISYPDAYAKIESEVNELKQYIDNDGFYELCDIGTLYLNNDGNLEFKPCEAGILTPDLYSLSSFEIKKSIVSNTNIEQEELLENNTASNKPTATITYATSPINKIQGGNNVGNDKFNTTENVKVQNVRLKVLKSIFAIIVAITTFFAWTSPINTNNRMVQMGNIDNGIIHNLLKKSYNNVTQKSIQLKQDKNNKTNTCIKQVDEYSKSEKKAVSSTTNNDKKAHDYFCLVLASRVTKKNAEIFVEKLRSNGFEATTLTGKNNSIKVVYGKYETKNEAYNALNELKGNEYFYEAWVYHIN